MGRKFLFASAVVSLLAQPSLAQTCQPHWSERFGGLPGPASAFAVYDDDGPGPRLPALYVGAYTIANQIPVGVYRSNGTSLFLIGGTFGPQYSYVKSLVVFDDDGLGGRPEALYAGGLFSQIGTVAVNQVARWDGSTWSPLGSGANSVINCFALYDDDGLGPRSTALYAAGLFTTAGGGAANRIARWDGAQWEPLGDGLDGEVLALAVFDEDGPGGQRPVLFVGGNFANAGGVAASYIARWDGIAWTPVGGGTNGIVRALLDYDDDGARPGSPTLFVGGDFTQAGGIAVGRVARWTGSQWTTPGIGMDDSVNCLAVYDEDEDGPLPEMLYAGGPFRNADGSLVEHIARWNGTTWTGLEVINHAQRAWL